RDKLSRVNVTIIEPAKRWRMPDWPQLWAYRELFLALGARDVRVRYKQTVLGALWALLQPLATMIMFTIIFGRFARMPSEGYPYQVFVYSALLPWTLFSATVTSGAASIVGNTALLTKVYFPRLLVPAATVAAPSVDFLVSTAFLLLLTLWYGVDWTWRLAVVPLLVVITMMLAIGTGTLLSSLTVTFRDTRFLVPFLIQLWLFATPIIYPSSLVPGRYRWLLWLNPMSGITDAFRSAFLGRPFNVQSLAVSAAIAAAMFLFGVAAFQSVEQKVADVL
ncbi:MAG TPA: ABC transporter permease, partial [Thermoanaerobaculia bacterium]|nr:ABC transporter permease [Thermoanaerobaculia bacterium]